MAVIIETTDPEGLLKIIRDDIKNGKHSTWEIYSHENVEYFTQAAGPNKKKAYLKPVVASNENRLKLAFYGAGKPLKRHVYSEFHAKFIQLILDNYDSRFKWASAGSKAISIDKFTLEN